MTGSVYIYSNWEPILTLFMCSDYCERLLEITRDYWRLLETINPVQWKPILTLFVCSTYCVKLLEITRDYWRLLEITGDY